MQKRVLIAAASAVFIADNYTISFSDLSNSDDSADALSRGCMKYRVGAIPASQ